VFVFATTEPQKIAQSAAPVLSRLQRFDLKRIGAGDIRDRLRTVLAEEGVEATDDALAMISRAADGSMRDALSLADQVISIGEGALTGERIREALGLVPEDEYLGILELIRDHRAADVFPLVSRLADAGVDFGVFLAGFGDVLRAQLAVTLGGKAESVSATVAAALAAQKDEFSPGDLLRMLSAIGTLEQSFKKSGQQQLLVEMLLVRFALLDRTVLLEDLLKGGSGAAIPPKPRTRKEPESLRSAAPAAPPPQTSSAQAPRRPTPPLADAREAMEKQAQSDSRQRITPEALREEKIGLLRKQDAALGAAIDELDLELLD
jgi:DNA polymerase-3 subunit gamma/tau